MSIDILRRSPLCANLTSEEVLQVNATARTVQYKAGEVICRQGEPGKSMFIILWGRAQVQVARDGGEYQLIDYLGQGDHFGEMAMLTGGDRTATVSAVIETYMMEIDQVAFEFLMENVTGFAANVSRTLGYRLQSQNLGLKRRTMPRVIGLVRATHEAVRLIVPLAAALQAAGDRVAVLTDRKTEIPLPEGIIRVHIDGQLPAQDLANDVQSRVLALLPDHDRILVELAGSDPRKELAAALGQCEQAWWLLAPAEAKYASERIADLLTASPHLAGKIHPVWMLAAGERYGGLIPDGVAIADRDFKFYPGASLASTEWRGSISRLVRHLQGTRMGLALGGGGAKGMAHLGVLRVLEEEGIFIDHVLGTSVGALVGLPYCGGFSVDFCIESFVRDLTPGWFFRNVPRGPQWFLIGKFRTGAWDRMLRKYMGNVDLRQLPIPLGTIAVDLVGGQIVERTRGDAIHAVLESINLPVIARPILRNGMALVDGGVLNNVPGDRLPGKGCRFVIGVDIAADLRPGLGRNTPDTPTHKMRRAGLIEALARLHEVQMYTLSARGKSAVDLKISVNTSDFGFADFTRARELAMAGEKATREMIPHLRQMMAEQKIV